MQIFGYTEQFAGPARSRSESRTKRHNQGFIQAPLNGGKLPPNFGTSPPPRSFGQV